MRLRLLRVVGVQAADEARDLLCCIEQGELGETYQTALVRPLAGRSGFCDDAGNAVPAECFAQQLRHWLVNGGWVEGAYYREATVPPSGARWSWPDSITIAPATAAVAAAGTLL